MTIKVIPFSNIRKNATSEELSEALESHLAETGTQISRLEQAFFKNTGCKQEHKRDQSS